jgi:hypothetical protein
MFQSVEVYRLSVLCGIAQCCNGDELCCFMKEGELDIENDVILQCEEFLWSTADEIIGKSKKFCLVKNILTKRQKKLRLEGDFIELVFPKC